MSKQKTENMVTEYMKCKQSFEYFCANYIILELPGGDVKFSSPYEPQLQLINLIDFKKFVLVLKSRQIGISTIVQAYIAWLCIFFSNTVTGIISKDGSESTSFARTVRGMIEKLPDWMKPKKGVMGRGFAKRSEQSFILTNGSKLYASTVNPQAPEKTLRGKAITFLVIDEAAFVNKIDEAWTGMVPALSTNQKAAKKANVPFGTVVLSTPNKTTGAGKWFFNRYRQAISGHDIFCPFVIHWKQVQELASDPEWYDIQCRLFSNDPRKIQQELDLKFLPTSGSFFDEKTITIMQEHKREPLEKVKLFNGEVWKFSNPIPKKHYLMAVDTAPEHGNDKSAITIWDYISLEQVWEYQGKCQVQDFTKVLQFACAQYPGTVVIESNSYGNQVIETMNSSDFSNMLYSEKIGESKKPRPGLTTTAKTRPLMIDALYSYITEFPEIVRSERLILELIGLVSKPNGRVEADTGCNDDIALTAAMAFYVRKYDPPLMLDTAGLDNSMFNEIMGLNFKEEQISNASVMARVKQDIEELSFGNNSIINVFDYYNN